MDDSVQVLDDCQFVNIYNGVALQNFVLKMLNKQLLLQLFLSSK